MRGLLVRLLEQRQLVGAADHRPIEATGAAGFPGSHGAEAARLGQWRPPPELQLLRLVELDRVADEAVRRPADEDLPGLGALLEAGGDVDGVAHGERRAGGGVARDDLARVHADPHLEPYAPLLLELVVQRREPVAHLGRRADAAERVVLVDAWDAEDGHDGVADELLDRAVVTLDDGAHLVEVADHDPPHRLWVEPLAQPRGAGHVGEDHRDGLAHLVRHRIVSHDGSLRTAPSMLRGRHVAGPAQHPPN